MKKLLITVLFFFLNVPVFAHHEAIFGPYSAMVSQVRTYVGTQMQTRQIGTAGERTQESTMFLSGGITPFKDIPLSFNLSLPISQIQGLDDGSSQRGLEDVILGSSYAYEIKPLQKALGGLNNLIMGMVSVELPTGSIDHAAMSGPVDYMAAGLMNFEWRQFGATLYSFNRLHGTSGANTRKGNAYFLGGGFTYTPWRGSRGSQFLSLQMGYSYEIYMTNTDAGIQDLQSGGQQFLLHPTIVWGPGESLQLFTVVSLPLSRNFNSAAEQDRWRYGLGINYLLGS